MNNTIIQQGAFTSSGSNVFIGLDSGIDWITVHNLTQGSTNQTTAVGVKYFWQKEMGNGTTWVTYKSNATNAANLEQYIVNGGVTYYDTSIQTPSALNSTITAISNATPPVVTNTGNNGLVPGSVVRLINVAGGQQLGGFDFTVGFNTLSATTFSLDYMSTIVAATTGSWRVIPFNPIFYPVNRFITKITQASQAVVTLSVTHGYQVGQVVRMVVPAEYGMVEMDGLEATITAINTTATTGNTITLDINSSSFTPFAFPLTAAVPFTPAEVVPVGMDTGFALAQSPVVDILSDATENIASMGVILTGGAGFPGGADDDVMVWVAGKSFQTDLF